MMPILTVIKIIFWGSAFLVAYTYVGYPLLIATWARLSSRKIQRKPIRPEVTIIVSAYNEEEHIAAKLESCFKIDYPQELIQLIVVSDGSTDKTESIVANSLMRHPNLTLIRLKKNNGKAAALNTAVSEARGQILIFTDARQLLARDAVSSLVENFADPSVGATSGELLFMDEQQPTQMIGISFYWKYEKWLRRAEAAVHSMCGATGALYAIRRELFSVLPQGLVLDDVLIPMRAPFAGYRIVFDGNAQAFDRIAGSTEAEFIRKVRTLYGNYQLLALEPRIWKPWFNPIFFQFFSHKICRLLAPFCLIAMFASNLFLLSDIYLLFFAMQLGWYMLALAGFLSNGLSKLKTKET